MKKTIFTYVDTEEELVEVLGMEREKILEYFSLEDMIFAIIFDGHRPPRSEDGECIEQIVESKYYEYKVVYIPTIDKIIGLRYI